MEPGVNWVIANNEAEWVVTPTKGERGMELAALSLIGLLLSSPRYGKLNLLIVSCSSCR